MLPSFAAVRPGGGTLDAWRFFPTMEEAMDVPALVGAIQALWG
jgi:hypothetical protein